MARGAVERASGADLEILRRRIWVLRSRGMTYAQIGKAVGKSASAVTHHIRQTRKNTYTQIDSAGQEEVVGEILLSLREMRQEALRNMSHVEQGSPMRAQWLDSAARRLNSEIKFMFDTNMIQRSTGDEKITAYDVRKMSDEEMERELKNLVRTLNESPLAEGTAPEPALAIEFVDEERAAD